MHATRGPLLPLLLGLSLAVTGCDDGNGAPCVLDSDCADVTQVCVEQRCRATGVVPDAAAPGDAGPRRDAGALDGGGGGTDSGPDEMDAGSPDAGPMCIDPSGSWQVLTIASGDGTCGAALIGNQTTLAVMPDAPCTYTASSAGGGTVALDGTFSIDADGVIDTTTATLTAGGDASLICTGTVTPDSIMLTCVGCTMELTPVMAAP